MCIKQKLKTHNENVMGEIKVIRICSQDFVKRSLSIPISNSQRYRKSKGCYGKIVQAKPVKQPEQLFHFIGFGAQHKEIRVIVSNQHGNEGDKPGFVMTWKLMFSFFRLPPCCPAPEWVLFQNLR